MHAERDERPTLRKTDKFQIISDENTVVRIKGVGSYTILRFNASAVARLNRAIERSWQRIEISR
jgi:hypothetical protein